MTKIINQQDQIDVFENEYGTLSIMSSSPGEDSKFICIAKEHAGILCAAIMTAAN